MFISISTTTADSAVDYTTTTEMLIDGKRQTAVARWNRYQLNNIRITIDGVDAGEFEAPGNPFDRAVEDAMLAQLAADYHGVSLELAALVIEHAELCQQGRAKSDVTKDVRADMHALLKAAGMERNALNTALCGDRRYFAEALESVEGELPEQGPALDPDQSHRITIEFGSYNHRRYSRPWIAAVVSWPVGESAQMVFGGYVGDDTGGEAEIRARIGSIVRWGQRDYRGNNTTAFYGIVRADGSVERLSEREARAAWGDHA